MKIIYLSTMCSEKKFADLFCDVANKPGQAVMKYHRLLSTGLARIDGVEVKAYSVLPVNRKNCSYNYIGSSRERIGRVKVKYLGILYIPLLKNLYLIIQLIYQLTKELKTYSDQSVIICDALNNTLSITAVIMSKILKVKSMAIVTDVPGIMFNSKKYVKLGRKLLEKYDSYLFLTENMDNLINKNNKPYIVQEGYVDRDMFKVQNILSEKNKKKTIMYTGTIDKIYGIKQLVQAFIECGFNDTELHIYGNGDYEKELKKMCKKHKNIKYFGVQLIEYVVKAQQKADLLVNPRFTNQEYTKYSFPSKNMEYMVSGTAVLTTKLPGMPKEYEEYVYLFEDESLQGFINTLRFVMEKSRQELNEKGKKAKDFVLLKKNNVYQADKLVSFLRKNL